MQASDSEGAIAVDRAPPTDGWRATLAGVALGLALIGLFSVAARVLDRPFDVFSRDLAEQVEVSSYTGYLATLTGVVWLAGGVSALVAALALHRVAEPREVRFLALGGLLTLLLVTDDLFLLHEGVYARAGVPQEGVYLVYAAAALAYLIAFRRELLAAEPFLFVAACAMLGLSTVVDAFLEGEQGWRHHLEDGSKLVGVILWSLFFVRLAVFRLRAHLARPAAA